MNLLMYKNMYVDMIHIKLSDNINIMTKSFYISKYDVSI